MPYNITQGSGTTMAADQIGTANAPASGQLLPYVKLDGGVAGASQPIGAANATNVTANSSVNAMLVSPPGQWSQSSNPGANAQATASQAAAGSGIRNVCNALSFSVGADGTAPTAVQLVVNLRNGATGAGTVLWTWTIAIPATAGAFNQVSISGLNIYGSANTAMTLEYAVAGGVHTYEACNIAGTTTQ